jgi:hypothetical protein
MADVKIHLILCASALAWLARPVHADVPAWCSGATFRAESNLFDELSETHDPQTTIELLAKASCSNDDAATAHRAEIDAARAAWGKKYGMAEADWGDVVAALNGGDDYSKVDLSANALTTLSPIDQYKVIAQGFGQLARDPFYFTDAFGAQLTETGRLAFVQYCLDNQRVPAEWAACQEDVDKLDVAKVYAELHADPHAGSAKHSIRMIAAGTADLVAAYAAKKAALIKKDGEYGRAFDVAAKARAEWATKVGTNTKLLALVTAMDSATVFHSRKQFDGCEAKTADALAAAVSEIPAKAFTGMHDDRNDPTQSFATKAKNVLARSSAVTLAAIAYAECQPKTGLGNYAANLLNGVPTARGPRDYALAALLATDFKFDDTNTKGLAVPRPGQRPYPYGQVPMSVGGTVKSVKLVGDTLDVALEKTAERVEDCVKEHEGHVVRIREDGSLEREIICDQTAMVTRDTSYVADFKINPTDQKWLKGGVLFSATYADSSPMDVIAVWPSKGAKLPSIVLGGVVK